MRYQFEPASICRLPAHFGPAPGLRQLAAAAAVDSTRGPHNALHLSELSNLTHLQWRGTRPRALS
jgi:hypothetical protein